MRSAASARLTASRAQILAFRRAAQHLDDRLPAGPRSLRKAAWAGLQDSMPRAALLSIHARVRGTTPATWEAPSLVQLWGPRYSAYVVDARDAAVFTVGRLPDSGSTRRVAEGLGARMVETLRDARLLHSEAARRLREPHNRLRYATLTGRLRIRWDGARQPIVWIAPPPTVDAREARLELARRFLHVFGPATPEGFAKWAGLPQRAAIQAFDALRPELVPVRTPVGDAWIVDDDEAHLRRRPGPTAPARLLPSGDTFFLFQSAADRALLVENAAHRARLWTSRVWPGAVLVNGDIAGTWRRDQATVTIEPWRRFSPTERRAVEAEVASLPLPGIARSPVTVWST
jgi:hypothetical protein